MVDRLRGIGGIDVWVGGGDCLADCHWLSTVSDFILDNRFLAAKLAFSMAGTADLDFGGDAVCLLADDFKNLVTDLVIGCTTRLSWFGRKSCACGSFMPGFK